MTYQRLLPMVALCLSGCATGVQVLKLQRQQLLDIEKSAVVVESYAGAGHFETNRYDLYLFLNSSKFNDILATFNNSTFEAEVGGRPVRFTLGSVQTAFRPGYPDMTVDVSATDIATGITAKLEMDTRWQVRPDPTRPDKLFLHMVATRVAPDLQWKGWSLGKWRFARDLMRLEVTKLTQKVPPIEIPVEQHFDFGNDAGFIDLTQIPTGRGTMSGRVTYPSSKVTGAVQVCHVLFLGNGIHIFANIQGLTAGEQACALKAF